MIFSLYSVAYVFLTPFLKLYTAGVNDISYIDKYLPLLFVLSRLLSCARVSCADVINYAQHYKLTQNRCIAEATINVVVSVACVVRFGIYGVLFGTIAALLYRANDMIIYANKKILNRSPWVTYKRWIILFAVFAFVVVFCDRFVNIQTDSYLTLILYAVVFTVCICVLYFSVMSIFEYKQAKEALRIMKIYLDRIKKRL